MSNDLSIPKVCGSPVASVGPTANFYLARAQQLCRDCAAAMRRGDLNNANELYERGINAMMNHLWHQKLALMVGDDLSVMQPLAQ